jgi:AhpD family alkylhydroperoxidase
MSRLARTDVESWDAELRHITGAADATPVELGPMRVLANCPAIAKGVARFALALRASRTLPERLFELVRLRIAFHNQCRSCMAIRYRNAVKDGVDEGVVCSLEKPMEAADLSSAERAALDFADRFANDHLSIDEATYEGLRAYFSESQLVELGSWVAFCVGFGRLMASWDLLEELPSEFQASHAHRLTPSSGVPLIVR